MNGSPAPLLNLLTPSGRFWGRRFEAAALRGRGLHAFIGEAAEEWYRVTRGDAAGQFRSLRGEPFAPHWTNGAKGQAFLDGMEERGGRPELCWLTVAIGTHRHACLCARTFDGARPLPSYSVFARDVAIIFAMIRAHRMGSEMAPSIEKEQRPRRL